MLFHDSAIKQLSTELAYDSVQGKKIQWPVHTICGLLIGSLRMLLNAQIKDGKYTPVSKKGAEDLELGRVGETISFMIILRKSSPLPAQS